MVRWPSGVTSTRQQPVGSLPLRRRRCREGHAGGAECRGANTCAEPVIGRLADEACRSPKEAMPTMALVTEPPEISMAGPMSG